MPRQAKTTKATRAAVPSEGFLTDQQVAGLGLDPESAEQVVKDAGLVYAQVQANAYITRDELVSWATAAWPQESAVGRLNAAIEFLQAGKKLLSLGG